MIVCYDGELLSYTFRYLAVRLPLFCMKRVKQQHFAATRCAIPLLVVLNVGTLLRFTLRCSALFSSLSPIELGRTTVLRRKKSRPTTIPAHSASSNNTPLQTDAQTHSAVSVKSRQVRTIIKLCKRCAA